MTSDQSHRHFTPEQTQKCPECGGRGYVHVATWDGYENATCETCLGHCFIQPLVQEGTV